MKKNITKKYNTPYQLKLPLEIEKLCKTDIRFMYLLDEHPVPSHMTIDNFMNEVLSVSISEIFNEINGYIFKKENVDINHIYIDGTKIAANANKYSWVWKKSSIKNKKKTFDKVTVLLEEINKSLIYHGVKFGLREEYAIEYLEDILSKYAELCNINPDAIIRGRGHHKTTEQRNYDKLNEYIITHKTDSFYCRSVWYTLISAKFSFQQINNTKNHPRLIIL